MNFQSELRRIAYDVLNTPGIQPGTKLAARNLLVTLRGPSAPRTRVFEDAHDLLACLAYSPRHRLEYAQLNTLLNPNNPPSRLQIVIGAIGTYVRNHATRAWALAKLLLMWSLIVSMVLLAGTSLYLIISNHSESWREHSQYGGPLIAFCGVVLIGLSGMLTTLKAEKWSAYICGTMLVIVSAFLIIINSVTPETTLKNDAPSLLDVAQEPLLVLALAMSASMGLVWFIAWMRYSHMRNNGQIP